MLQDDSWDAWKHRLHALVMEELSSAWQGLYKGIMDIALWFLKLWPIMSSGNWHAFFGMARSNNDVNVLQHSLVFARLA
jgi:hypothetical protein